MSPEYIILSNCASFSNWDENSFTGTLHEKWFWNEGLYWDVECALYAISAENNYSWRERVQLIFEGFFQRKCQIKRFLTYKTPSSLLS